MHDCSVATGDRFLSVLVPRLLQGLGPHGYLVLTFDEGISAVHGGGRITTIVAGPDVVRGGKLAGDVDHYGVLRTIEDTFGLPHLGAAADPHNGSLRGLFARATAGGRARGAPSRAAPRAPAGRPHLPAGR
jgi:hypothetical protein